MKILIQSNNKQKLASKIAAASFIKQGFTHDDIKFLEFENNSLLKSKINNGQLQIKGVVKNWEIGKELEHNLPDELIDEFSATSEIKNHGIIKCSLMI